MSNAVIENKQEKKARERLGSWESMFPREGMPPRHVRWDAQPVKKKAQEPISERGAMNSKLWITKTSTSERSPFTSILSHYLKNILKRSWLVPQTLDKKVFEILSGAQVRGKGIDSGEACKLSKCCTSQVWLGFIITNIFMESVSFSFLVHSQTEVEIDSWNHIGFEIQNRYITCHVFRSCTSNHCISSEQFGNFPLTPTSSKNP